MGRNIPVARMSAEQRARKRLSNARYREQNRAKLAAAERARQAPHRKPRVLLTPEEASARQKASKQRWAARNREHQNAQARQKRLEHGEEMRAAERERRKSHPGEGNARAIAWAKANPDKARAASNKWKATNPEKAKASRDAWKAAHPGLRYPERERAYSLAHAVEIRQRASAWRKANPAHAKALSLAAKARRRNAPINDVTPAQRQAVIDAARGRCVYCPHYNPTCKACRTGTHKLTIDHITAIIEGGPHTLHNLVACCHLCNSKKRARKNPVPVQPLLL